MHVRHTGVSLGEASLLQLATANTNNAFKCLLRGNRQHARTHRHSQTTEWKIPCTQPTANGYLRGCHGSWLIISVSSRHRRAMASRPLAHMLVQLHDGHFSYFADSGRRRQHLDSKKKQNFVTNSARSQSELRCTTVKGGYSRRYARRMIAFAHTTGKRRRGARILIMTNGDSLGEVQ